MLLKERLQEALDRKANDISNFVWKGAKVKEGKSYKQQTIKMVDCTVEQLKQFYKQCEEMLYNNSKEHPGRYVLMDIIQVQRMKCNTELFLRWLNKQHSMTRFNFMNTIRTFLKNNEGVNKEELTLNDMIGQCPPEYADIPVDMVLDGCMDTLGLFHRKHLTNTFLLKHGIWPTQEERKKLKDDKQKLTPEFMLDYVGLLNPRKSNDATYSVRLNSRGLSLAQMKAMISLTTMKYSEMSTLQLETLRNRVLYSLENDVRFHIKQWETRMEQLRKVIESKGSNV